MREFEILITDKVNGKELVAKTEPSIISKAGIAGEHKASRLIFCLPDTWSTDWTYFVECVNSMGEGLPSAGLTAREVGGVRIVAFDIPQAMTEMGSSDYVLKAVSYDGEEVEKIIRSATVRVCIAKSPRPSKKVLEAIKTVYEELIAKLNALVARFNNGEFNGATFTPSVSQDGDLSWSNDKGLTNPESVNIKGPKGDKGDKGDDGKFSDELADAISKNTAARHTHANKELLDTLTESMIGTLDVYHELPETANDGDICIYSPANVPTVADSGKLIYVDWDVFNQTFAKEDYTQFSIKFFDANGEEVGLIYATSWDKADGGYDTTFEYTKGNEKWSINFSDGVFDAKNSGYTKGETTIYFTTVPTSFTLPFFSSLVNDHYNIDGDVFYAPIKLMVYRGGWYEYTSAATVDVSIGHGYELPENAKEGDIFLYAPQNTLTLADSGKRIYFDWEEFRKPVGEDEVTQLSLAYNLIEEGTVIEISAERTTNNSSFWVQRVNIDNGIFESLAVAFYEGVLDTETSLYEITDAASGNAETTYFNNIDELPLYFDIPKFDETTSYEITGNEYFFHSEYKLMKYQGGKWIEAVETDVSAEQIAAAVRDYLNENPIEGGSVEIDTTLTQEGEAADAKATGDRLTDIEYQTVTTDLAFEHKGLPIGKKTVIVNGDGTFGNNAYVVCGEDIIPRKTFNQKFPHNGITVTKNDKTYHIEGTATEDGSVCFVDEANTSMFEINKDISGKAFKLLSFSNQYLNQWSTKISFYDSNKKAVQVLKANGSLSTTISNYVGSANGYRETDFSIPENVDIKYAQVAVNFKANNTYNHDFQIYVSETENIQAVTLESPTATITDTEVTNVFTAPYQSATETRAPIAEYIKYMLANAKGDTVTYLTPEAFGAVGDGYADDTEAVKACIAKAAETTQTVFMAKKYLITAPIEIFQNGLDLIANDIVYSGTDAAIKIQGSNNTLKFHNVISSGIGIVFTGGGNKQTDYNLIDINSIESKLHGIVFYFNQKGIAQNTIHFNHIRCNGSGCYGIAYLDHENKLDTAFIGESNFYGGHISHCEWACYRVGGNAKFYGIHIEVDVEGGFYIKDGVRIIQPRYAEGARDGSYPFFKILNAKGVKIDSSSLCTINEIDISENRDYYENVSGAQYPAHEGNFGIIEIPLIMPRQSTGDDVPTANVYTNKAYIWGKHLIMTPYMAYRKRVITETLDTRLIVEVKDTIDETMASVHALSQLPTKFVVDTINTEIYLHSSYCAFGFNEFEVEQANGFTCKIYDVHENLIFDGTNKDDGLYKLNVYKDADICINRVGTKGMLSVDFMGHYWQVLKLGATIV